MDPKSVKEFPERHTDDEENTELKMKLYESEKNIVKLKENVEELSLEKSQLMERGEELMEENSKLPMKTDVVVKLKAETEELNSEIAKRRSK
jgi:predicted nuclease with TOPRIM domain